jgi:hypothetical protein
MKQLEKNEHKVVIRVHRRTWYVNAAVVHCFETADRCFDKSSPDGVEVPPSETPCVRCTTLIVFLCNPSGVLMLEDLSVATRKP